MEQTADTSEAPQDAPKMSEKEQMERLALQYARTNAMGKIIKSAEPYGYFQDSSDVEHGLRLLDLNIVFNRCSWGVNTVDVQNLFTDLGFDKPLEKIQSIGRFGKRITITAANQEVKKYIVDTLTEKFRFKYKVSSFDEDEVVLNIFDVPHLMHNDRIKEMLTKYGTVGDVIQQKDDLGFPNTVRTVVMQNLVFDIPSYIKVKGYVVQPRYPGQPRTCRKCGKRGHEGKDCPENQPVAKEGTATAANEKKKPLTKEEEVIKAIAENIALLEDKHGSSVNSPKFRQMIYEETQRLTARNNDNKKKEKKLLQMNSTKGNESDAHIVNRTGYKPSYYRDNDNFNKKRKLEKENRNNDRWEQARRRGQRNKNNGNEGQSSTSRRPFTIGDFLQSAPPVSNKFNVLAHDLRLSGSSEDEDDHVRHRPRYANGNGF